MIFKSISILVFSMVLFGCGQSDAEKMKVIDNISKSCNVPLSVTVSTGFSGGVSFTCSSLIDQHHSKENN